MGGRKSAFLDFFCQQEYSTKISSKKILRVNSHDLLIYSDGHIYQRMKVYFRNSIPIISIPTKKWLVTVGKENEKLDMNYLVTLPNRNITLTFYLIKNYNNSYFSHRNRQK